MKLLRFFGVCPCTLWDVHTGTTSCTGCGIRRKSCANSTSCCLDKPLYTHIQMVNLSQGWVGRSVCVSNTTQELAIYNGIPTTQSDPRHSFIVTVILKSQTLG